MKEVSATAGLAKPLQFFVPIAKVDEEKRMVYGYASTDTEDAEGETITRAAMKAALPGYLEWANLREMHQLSAVGTTETAVNDDKGTYISAKVVDDNAWKKVTSRVYKGFSIGGRATKRDPDNAKVITGLELVEISLVDRPCNPDAKIDSFKGVDVFKVFDVSMLGKEEEKAEGDKTAKVADKEQPKVLTLEEKARELCKAAGQDPERVIAHSKQGADVLAWHTFKGAAGQALAAEDRIRKQAAREEEALRAARTPAVVVKQLWSCGMLSHSHETEDEARKCATEQETAGFDEDAIERRLQLAQAIDVLGPEALASTAKTVTKSVAGEEKKEEVDEKPAKPTPDSLFSGFLDSLKIAEVREWATANKGAILDLAAGKKGLQTPTAWGAGHVADFESNLTGYIDACGKALGWKETPEEAAKADKPKSGKGKPTVLLEDVGHEHETEEELRKADGEKPEGDYGSHDDAGYADPGYQDDKKPRYPLKSGGKYNAGRIRAAWNYISKEKNAAQYSAKQLGQIKSRIIAAWKDAIDKDGPPSAKDGEKKVRTPNRTEDTVKNEAIAKLGKADTTKSLKKGLGACCTAIGLLESMNYLHKSLAAEAAQEGDNSPVPDRMMEVIKMMSSLTQEILAEEIEELLANKELESMGAPMAVAYAAKILKTLAPIIDIDAFVKRLEKSIGDRTGDPGYEALAGIADMLKGATLSIEEWGNRNGGDTSGMDEWRSKAQSIHDAVVGMGATCAKAEKAKKAEEDDGDGADEEGAEEDAAEHQDPGAKKDKKKAAKVADEDDDEDDTSKARKADPALTKLMDILGGLAEKVDSLEKTLESGRRDPRRPGAKAATVEKQGDHGGIAGAAGKDDSTLGPDGKPDPSKVLDKVFQNPRVVAGIRG